MVNIINHDSINVEVICNNDHEKSKVPTPPRCNMSVNNRVEATSNFLNIICWNRGFNNKLLDQENQNLLFNYNIIIIIETHSSEQQSKQYDIIPGFKYYDFPRKYIHPRAPKPSGGIGIFIKQCLTDSVKVCSTTECLAWITLNHNSFGWERDKLKGCIYFSPIDSSYLHNTIINTDYLNILQDQLAQHNDQEDIFYLWGP